MADCPICNTETNQWKECPGGRDGNEYDCPNCGEYSISRTTLSGIEGLGEKARTVLSHAVWKNQEKVGKRYEVLTGHLKEAKNGELPNPAEQLDCILLFYGKKQKGAVGKLIKVSREHLRAKIGAISTEDVGAIFKYAVKEGLIEQEGSPLECRGKLTLRGWKHYAELKRGQTESRTAFMAMDFNNPEVGNIVDKVFKQAVEETGFKLKRLDDNAPAGLIDNRLRVEIRMCRFLIVDLTDENRGAYWEAGYAEGLGKPVIYTCSKAYFDDGKKIHFDTNHHHTILWDPEQPEKAAEDLKSTIRATLPFEAKMPEEQRE